MYIRIYIWIVLTYVRKQRNKRIDNKSVNLASAAKPLASNVEGFAVPAALRPARPHCGLPF